MNIDIEKLKDLIPEADKIFLSPDGEEVLIKLLEIKQQVENAIEAAKGMLEKKALELNPNFSSIQADKVKVYYRAYGAKYKIDLVNIEKCPKNFYKVRTVYDVIAKEVEKWTESHKGLPLGINEIERPKSLSFSLKSEEV
jgi:hypothetical protein